MGLPAVSQTSFISALLTGVALYQLLGTSVWDHLLSQPFSSFDYPLHIDMPKTVEKVLRKENPWAQMINDPKYPFVINPDTKCRDEGGGDENVFLLLLIKSRILHFDQRRIIRRTWGLETAIPYVNIKRVFLVGVHPHDRTVQHRLGIEHQDYNDIVQQYFTDDYFNNTLKVMMGLQWAQRSCPSAQFLAFFDDDYYVNTFQVVRTLQEIKPIDFPNTLISYIWKNAVVMRDHNQDGWSLSREEYPYRYFPPYPTAGSFLMPMATAERLHIAMKFTKYLRFDDIFLGIVAWKLHLKLIHNSELHYTPLPYSPFRYQEVLAVHGFNDIELLYTVWKEQYQLQETKRR